MRPLERAIAALKESLGASEHPGLDPVRDVIVDGRCDMDEAVRAVLKAIREPSDAMLEAGWAAEDNNQGSLRAMFAHMVDAALEEAP